MSDHFTKSVSLGQGTRARSANIDTEFTAVESGFTSLEAEVDATIRVTGAGMSSFTLDATAKNRANKVLGFNAAGDEPLLVDTDTPEIATTLDDPLTIARGGTGAATAAAAITNLSADQYWNYVGSVNASPDNLDFLDFVASAGNELASGFDHRFHFRWVIFELYQFQNSFLQMRLGTGGTFLTSTGDYHYQAWSQNGTTFTDVSTKGDKGGSDSDRIWLASGYQTGSNSDPIAKSKSTFRGDVILFDPVNASTVTTALWRIGYYASVTMPTISRGFARTSAAQKTDEVRFLQSVNGYGFRSTSYIDHYVRKIN